LPSNRPTSPSTPPASITAWTARNSPRAKWVFGTREAADTFAAQNGGSVVAFEPAVKAAFEDLYVDTKLIRERREAKRKAAAEKK